jgi:general stress protein 26
MTDSDTADQVQTRERVLDIARSARFCMLTVADPRGGLLSRPMTPLEVSDAAELLFLVDTAGALADQVALNRNVNLAFTDGTSWLSISGRAKVLHDPTKVADLWTAAAEAWFPEGPDEPRLGVLRVRGRSAEYWETPGGRIATALSFIKAKATGRPLDADNETLDLR